MFIIESATDKIKLCSILHAVFSFFLLLHSATNHWLFLGSFKVQCQSRRWHSSLAIIVVKHTFLSQKFQNRSKKKVNILNRFPSTLFTYMPYTCTSLSFWLFWSGVCCFFCKRFTNHNGNRMHGIEMLYVRITSFPYNDWSLIFTRWSNWYSVLFYDGMEWKFQRHHLHHHHHTSFKLIHSYSHSVIHSERWCKILLRYMWVRVLHTNHNKLLSKHSNVDTYTRVVRFLNIFFKTFCQLEPQA